jgi:two-component system, NarL family, nitrate/nitrite response regulator NarL
MEVRIDHIEAIINCPPAEPACPIGQVLQSLKLHTMSRMTIRTSLLVVEDHPLYRHGLVELLVRSAVADQVHTATSAASAVSMLASTRDIDMVLSDWRLPDGDGLTLLKSVAKTNPTTARVLMSGTDDPRLPALCIEAGLAAFLPKSLEPHETIAVITRLLDGETWFPSTKSDQRMLTPRQTEILMGIAAGKTNKHLARELGITERTVKHHLTAVFERLGTTRRAEAVSRAVSEGLIQVN